MKRLPLLFTFMSVCEILFSQNITVVSSSHDYPALKGDQVITCLYPTNPTISCFICGNSYCEAIGSLGSEKISYEWDTEFKNRIFSWDIKDCIVTSEDSEYICTKYSITNQ